MTHLRREDDPEHVLDGYAAKYSKHSNTVVQCRAYGTHQEDPGRMEYPPMLLVVNDLLIRDRLHYILQDSAGLYSRQSGRNELLTRPTLFYRLVETPLI